MVYISQVHSSLDTVSSEDKECAQASGVAVRPPAEPEAGRSRRPGSRCERRYPLFMGDGKFGGYLGFP